MIYNLLNFVDKHFQVNKVAAHCDIPCKIYDPIKAQIDTLSIIRFTDLIAELEAKSSLDFDDRSKLSRLVREKEIHAEQVKQEVRTIWGDYFKQPQIEKYPDIHAKVHSIMLAGSACKQSVKRENAVKLLDLVNEFATIFWETKGVETYSAQCPYPPAETVVYPRLS